MYWMFVEGLFLHNQIASAVFSTEAPFKLFCFIGWGKLTFLYIVKVLLFVDFMFHDNHRNMMHNEIQNCHVIILYQV